MNKILISFILIASITTSSNAMGNNNPLRATLMIDNLEQQFNEEETISWDTYTYIGYDTNKIYIYSEGEKARNDNAHSETQLVYSCAISSFWDIQIGVGYDISDEFDKKWGVIGVQGLAPYFFETRASILMGEGGNIGFRAETEYEALITQKLILTPSVSMSAYTKENLEMDEGSGFSNIKVGMRLRYEMIREFAPYIGLEWNKNLGKTNDISNINETYMSLGIRIWF